MLNQYNDILTIEELCEVLMIGRNQAYKLLNSQELQGFRIGKVWKIPKISVEKYILEQSTTPKPHNNRKN